MRTSAHACVAVVLALGAAAPAALADTSAYSFDVEVSRADTPAGARAVFSELEHRAGRLCADWTTAPVHNRRMERACRKEVIKNAVVQIDQPLLTALYHAEKTEAAARSFERAASRDR